jgi:predicted PurR-regulated permease PerM
MKAFLFSLIFMSSVTVLQAQNTAKEETKASTKLQNQFKSLKENANNYREGNREYKVVSISSLDTFWESIEKNIKATEEKLEKARNGSKDELLQAQAKVDEQQAQIEALQKDNALKDEEVKKSDSISVFGIFYIPKQAFVILMFSVIGILLIVAGVLYFQFKNSKEVTDEKKRAYDTIDLELQEVKKNAREKELKLKRDLQTEMNRIEELNQEISALQKKVMA